MPEKREVEIRCQQVLQPDGSVFSLQSLDLPPRLGASLTTQRMLEWYLLHVRRVTFSLVRPVADADGIRFTLLGSRLSLLRFAPAELLHDAGREELRLRIAGGALVQRKEAGRGALSFIISRGDAAVTVTLELAGFFPMLLGSRHPSLLAKLLYRGTQARIHIHTGVKYLCLLYRDLTGITPIPAKKRVRLREGTES
jgi:hypothetical protein